MKVLIVGTGSTAALVGARLIERGVSTTFLSSNARKATLLTRGLHVRSPFGRFGRPVNAITQEEIDGPFRIVVIATHAHQFEAGLAAASSAFASSSIVVPMCEGIRPFDLRARSGGPRIINAVFEARVATDADGVVVQRTPSAELRVGEPDGHVSRMSEAIAKFFRGRGLHATAVENIRARGWERFSFMASSVAAQALQGRPLRDTLRFPFGAGNLDGLLKEAFQIGAAAGYGTDYVRTRAYRRDFLLESRPVQPAPMISDGGIAGEEAFFLMSEMMGVARRSGCCPITFMSAWRAVVGDHARKKKPAHSGTGDAA